MAAKKRILYLLIALLMLAPAAGAYELHINVGGPGIELPDGTIFLADGAYTPERGYGWEHGDNVFNWHAIGGCLEERIYQYFHFNCGIYHLDVPNDSYVLTLHFCEAWGHTIGQFVVDWKINGSMALDDLDVYAVVWRDYALDYRFPITVTGGEILLDDVPSMTFSQLSAVSLVSHTPD
ncbi:MAG: hypothetical protein KAY24_09355, partial [Candidatus Eisenbacteria sp.]|nr:hypothetical protein [Candidatus Eisenbacteria bacterium]